ncbi:MAG: DUF4124 domain-containing protein [Chiayiivirga sp.]|jgi:hypothetical protein|uniref:DUF4124 domain-containing protein n=1 Tax=Chiayiivirga sp. TaxID=2041042 RepID=UPI0025BCB2C9|nr:DUF4124 domain-containing protein [Chiayiivirga sp.]MCI1728431.1 DUF4124 domain-containing protein [Chiayiivirga sp.]
MSVLHIVLPVATMLLLAASSSQASAVYKWTDDKGVVQYTDAPPEGRKFERLDVRGASTQSAPTEENLPDVAGTEEEPNPAQQRLAAMKINCQHARDNLATLEKYQVVTSDRDGDGKQETLDAAGREDAIARSRELIRQNCVE